jgi:hypothetical protein
MTYTRQTFELVASILNDSTLHLQDAKRAALASRFADAFTQSNPRFDRTRFYAACGVDSFYMPKAEQE